MKLHRQTCIVPGCNWRHTVVEDGTTLPIQEATDTAFLAHVAGSHVGNTQTADPYRDDALYREGIPCRPSGLANTLLGPTAQWLAHSPCQQPAEVVDDFGVDGMEPAA